MHKEEQLPNPDGWHGSVLSLTIEGNWQYYRYRPAVHATVGPRRGAAPPHGLPLLLAKAAGQPPAPEPSSCGPPRRSKLVRYLRQIAVITPYAQFSFAYKAEDEKHNMSLVFR